MMKAVPLRQSPSKTFDTDVLVIGGGFAGLFTTYFLAQEGVEIMMIDEDDFCTKASGVNAGNIHQQLMTYNYHNYGWEWFERWAVICKYLKESFAIWQRLRTEIGPAIDLNVCGGLTVAETQEQLELLRRKVDLENHYRLETVILTRSDLFTMAPYISEKVIGASFCKAEGKINPLAAMPALLKAALATGSLRIHRHCRVLKAERVRGYYSIKTNLGSIRCRHLVNAAGAGAPRVASLLGLQVNVEQRPIQMLATESVEPFLHHLLYHAKERMSLKQVSNGNVLVGGGWLGGVDKRTGLNVVNKESILGSLRVAASVVPAMYSLSLLRCWGGIIFTPPDGLPIVGRAPGHEGLFLAVSNHFGVTLGPLIGRTLMEIILGKAPSIDLRPLACDRRAPVEVIYAI